jgi:hypothetical protein
MSTPREQAIEMAINAIELCIQDQRDWLEETNRGERIIIHMKKLSNQLRRKIGADEISETV